MTRSSYVVGMLAACAYASIARASGASLYQQLPAPEELFLQVASQDFPDAAPFTIAAADDFSVPDGPGWHVDSLHSVFTTGGSFGDPIGLRWVIWNGDGLGGVPGSDVLTIEGGQLDSNTGMAQIDLASLNADFDLSPGAYWFTAQLIGDIGTFGQEYIRGSMDGAATWNFHWNNPGGGFGLPSGWIDANGINPDTDAPWSDVSNLAFGIDGSIVPEPATLGLMLLGAVAILRRRR